MSGFRLDIHSAAGVLHNSLTQISRVMITQRASRLGGLSFDVPKTIADDRGVGRGKIYKLYHADEGMLGTFYHATQMLNPSGDVLSVVCYDQLYELTKKTVGFNWGFSGENATAAMSKIIARYGGSWSVSTDLDAADFYEFTYDTAGESYFQLFEQVRKSQAGWFALSATKTVKYGRWIDSELDSATPSAILVNVADATAFDSDNILIENLSYRDDTSSITNRVIAVGQGLGATQLNLSYSDRTTPYTIMSRANWDAGNDDGTTPNSAYTNEHYIEDADSQADHGVSEATVHFDVKPVTNSQADLLDAGNALYDAATAYLLRSRNPLVNYEISCAALPKSVTPGSVVIVDYFNIANVINASGAVVRQSRLRLNKQRLWVSDITRTYDEFGAVAMCQLVVSTTGEMFADANEIITDLLRDAKRFRLRPQPSMCLRSQAGVTSAIKSGLDYSLKFKYGEEVLEINSAKIVFNVAPLRSYSSNNTDASSSSTTASGGGSSQTSSSGGASSPTSGSSSAGSSDPFAGTAINGQNQAGDSGFTGYAWNVTGDTSNAATGWNSTAYTGVGINNTGGVTGETSVISHGGDDNYYNHWHSAGDHTHEGDDHVHGIGYHYHSIGTHTHGIAHTHTVSIGTHTHDVTIAAHTHGMSHTHGQSFGVFEDSVTPSTVTVWLDGVQITPIKNRDTGQFAGNSVSGAGWFYVDIRPRLEAVSDWRGSHEILIKCASGQGLVFAQTDERLTIQPIALAE